MRRSALLAFAALSSLGALRAEDDREREARAFVAATLAELARTCSESRAADAAREELEVALLAADDPRETRRAIEALRGRSGAGDARLEEERRKAHEACVARLAALAPSLEGDPERWSRCLDLLDRLPGGEVARRFGAVRFDPYLLWTKPDDRKRLDAGGERIDGRWLARDEVRALDRAHAKWESPWVVSDEGHEVSTTLPYRSARQVLAHVGAFRRFFFALFADGWDLRFPKGKKLPIVLSLSHAEMKARAEAWTKEKGVGGQPVAAAVAFYFQSNGALDPCFVSLDVPVGGAWKRTDVPGMLEFLRHELVHQLAYEGSKHEADRTRTNEHQEWCVEGIATYLQAFALEPRTGAFTLSRPREGRIRAGGETIRYAAPFAWCKENRKKLLPLSRLFALTREKVDAEEARHVAATATWFLLEGEGGKYRPGFLRLLEAVHRVRETDRTFEQCFPQLDRAALQAEFGRFVAGIELSEEPPKRN